MIRDKGCPYLTEEDMERIAERAADKAVLKFSEQVYIQIGKSVVNRIFLVTGAAIIALTVWLHSKGFL